MKPSTQLSGWAIPGCVAMALGMTLVAPVPAVAQPSQQIQLTQQSQPKRAAVKVYTHSSGAFSLIPPQGSQLAERQGALSVTIRSPKGYMISIQGGADRGDMTLAQRMAAFEEQNVGEGKRWPRKLGGRETQVNEYPAFEALYLSDTEAARATIIRVANIDYVFIFVAPPANYAAELGEYFAVMASFHPGGSVAPASAPAGHGQAAPDSGRHRGDE